MHDAFARDLAEVINRHSVENVSNTPDIVLAAFLVECLDAFDVAVNERTALAAKSEADALTGAYRERAHLLALIAAQYPSHIGHTDDSAPDWAVLTVELPTGQACWHIATGDMDLFGHVDQEPARAVAWDGHTTEQKYQRIDDLTQHVHGQRFDEQVY